MSKAAANQKIDKFLKYAEKVEKDQKKAETKMIENSLACAEKVLRNKK